MKKITGLDCIILVDDDRITNFVHKKIIKRSEIDVFIKVNNSVPQAIGYLKKMNDFSEKECPRPGIIFLDINMPGMDGWDFIEEYKKLSEIEKPNIIIVMLTTSVNPNDKLMANSIPEINTFLNKPLTLEKLDKTISKYYSVS